MSTLEQHYTVVNDGTDPESWWRDRQGYCGASETAAILGLSKYSTPLDVWKAKQPDAEPIEENRFMMWGKRLEPVVAEWAEHDYSDVLGTLLPSPGLLVSTEYPFLAATPDRENDQNGRRDALTELKTGSEYTKDQWFADDYSSDPAVPMQYEIQVQQQLRVRGFDHGYIVPLLGGNHLLPPRRIDLDEAFIDIMLDELATWWEKHIVRDIPPAATRLDDLKAMFPGKPDTKIDATPEILAKVEKRNRLQPRLSRGKKYDDELKGDIQAFMGNATALVDPNTGRVVTTWNVGAKATQKFDVVTFATQHPDLYKQYLTTKAPGRTMRFTK